MRLPQSITSMLQNAVAPEMRHTINLMVGATPNHILSMSSLTMYLEQQGFTPSRGIGCSDIPYRQV